MPPSKKKGPPPPPPFPPLLPREALLASSAKTPLVSPRFCPWPSRPYATGLRSGGNFWTAASLEDALKQRRRAQRADASQASGGHSRRSAAVFALKRSDTANSEAAPEVGMPSTQAPLHGPWRCRATFLFDQPLRVIFARACLRLAQRQGKLSATFGVRGRSRCPAHHDPALAARLGGQQDSKCARWRWMELEVVPLVALSRRVRPQVPRGALHP